MSKQSTSFSLLFAAALVLGSCTLEDLSDMTDDHRPGSGLNEKVVLGLRKALEVGIDSSAKVASKVNGYLGHKIIKILLPEEAEQALLAVEQVADMVKPFSSELKAMQTVVDFTGGVDKNAFAKNLSASGSLITEISGLESVSDSVIKYMNRAAEIAAPRSVPIFKGAITTMTIADGYDLLNSPDSTAATLYLNGKTFSPLVSAYSPIVDSTLTMVPLTQYWGSFRTNYNAILANYNKLLAFQAAWNSNADKLGATSLRIESLKSVNNKPIQTESLGEWTTTKALGGLFFLVGEEEKDIRRDPLGYVRNLASDVSDLLKEVFGEIMKMQKQ